MFYLIATVLIIISLFFVYNAVTAFNELRKKVVKKVPAKPYMVGLFLFIALIFIALAVLAIIYQSTWDQLWNEFWINHQIIFSDETKSKIFNVTSKGQSIALYATIAFGILFTMSLQFFRKMSIHLFVVVMSTLLITFLCFIANQYTEPENLNESTTLNETAITEYFQNKDTDVIKLSVFVKNYFRVPRMIEAANVDQLRQYMRGLTEIKQNLARVEIPQGAEAVNEMTATWLNDEIRLVTDCLAEKRESGIFGLAISFNNAITNFIFDKKKEHLKDTERLKNFRRKYITDDPSAEENLQDHFSFIK